MPPRSSTGTRRSNQAFPPRRAAVDNSADRADAFQDDASRQSSTDSEGDESGSDSHHREPQTRRQPPMMIDWRRKICSFLKIEPACTDDQIIEMLEAKDKLLTDAEFFKSLASSKQGPPRVQVLNRINCHSSQQENLYLDEPWIVESGPYRAHLCCSGPIDNLELYLERNKDIVCIAYRDYDCCESSPPIPNPAHSDLFVTEKIDIVSDAQKTAWSELIEVLSNDGCISTERSAETLELETDPFDQESQHPYLWWFHNRRGIEIGKARISKESKDQVEAFQSYLKICLGDEWAKVDALMTEGRITAQYLDYVFAPGQIIVSKLEGVPIAQWRAYTATSWLDTNRQFVRAGSVSASITAGYWDFDGNFQKFDTSLRISRLPSMTEEFSINSMMIFPVDYGDSNTICNLRRRGQMFWKCRHRKYVSVRGAPEDHMYNASSGSRFMIDIATYRQMHPPSDAQLAPARYQDDLGPEVMAQDNPSPDLGDEFYMCLPTFLYGFNMQKKDWVKLDVDLLQEVIWNEEAFDLLVMEPQTKELVQAVVTNHLDGEIDTDVIHGKGNGLFILLHGGPGTGKTLTAESVAEISKKPLYRVTCGDVGTKAEEVERYLEVVSLLGKTWGCVVLLDEADVFLEQRKLDSLERNALVSVFLRVLEYYDGIMILTSNRVGIFDEAFKSRIQLSLRYNDLDQGQRRKIWANFINRLEKLEFQRTTQHSSTMPGNPRITPRAGVDIQSIRERLDDLIVPSLNGREIRNMISTARQLAVFRGEKLCYQHLETVMAEAQKFGEYIKRLHKGFTWDQIKNGQSER